MGETDFLNGLLFRTPKRKLLEQVEEAPLKPQDIDFLKDCINLLPYKELMAKYNLSMDGVYKRKCRTIDRFKRYLYYTEN